MKQTKLELTELNQDEIITLYGGIYDHYFYMLGFATGYYVKSLIPILY